MVLTSRTKYANSLFLVSGNQETFEVGNLHFQLNCSEALKLVIECWNGKGRRRGRKCVVG